MDRNLPKNLNASILGPILGHPKKERTSEGYSKKIYKHERKLEESLIEIFNRINIISSVKTDPFSLPYTDEIKVKLMGESWMNGPYEFSRVARKIVKELFEKDIYKIRFYIYIEYDTEEFPMGSMIYHFRYYIH
jgi:hypothetical protein